MRPWGFHKMSADLLVLDCSLSLSAFSLPLYTQKPRMRLVSHLLTRVPTPLLVRLVPLMYYFQWKSPISVARGFRFVRRSLFLFSILCQQRMPTTQLAIPWQSLSDPLYRNANTGTRLFLLVRRRFRRAICPFLRRYVHPSRFRKVRNFFGALSFFASLSAFQEYGKANKFGEKRKNMKTTTIARAKNRHWKRDREILRRPLRKWGLQDTIIAPNHIHLFLVLIHYLTLRRIYLLSWPLVFPGFSTFFYFLSIPSFCSFFSW